MVDRFKRDIDGCVASDGDIGPEQIVIDGGCDANDVNPKLAEHVRSRLGPIAANHHHPVDAALGKVAECPGPPAFLTEIRGSSTAKKRAADLNNAAHIARAELPELAVDKALPTLAYAVDRHALIERTARDGPYRRIHARGVTTACKDSNVFHESEITTVCRKNANHGLTKIGGF